MHQRFSHQTTGFLIWRNGCLLFIFHSNLNTTLYQDTLDVDTAGRHRGQDARLKNYRLWVLFQPQNNADSAQRCWCIISLDMHGTLHIPITVLWNTCSKNFSAVLRRYQNERFPPLSCIFFGVSSPLKTNCKSFIMENSYTCIYVLRNSSILITLFLIHETNKCMGLDSSTQTSARKEWPNTWGMKYNVE